MFKDRNQVPLDTLAHKTLTFPYI
uniref:Uncharacterized protein n=1 Tax=Arundo donax TaxID=35708 RepID=A0A0A9H7G5_ARUDO